MVGRNGLQLDKDAAITARLQGMVSDGNLHSKIGVFFSASESQVECKRALIALCGVFRSIRKGQKIKPSGGRRMRFIYSTLIASELPSRNP